jgi:hypothetical protein
MYISGSAYAVVGNEQMKRLITCFAVVVALSGCGVRNRAHDVADVTKPETLILTKSSGQGPIYSLTVIGSGKIHGTAEITLILNGGPYKTETLSGSVKSRWGGDWYSDQAEIQYTPTSVTGGNLTLKYKFSDL